MFQQRVFDNFDAVCLRDGAFCLAARRQQKDDARKMLRYAAFFAR